MSKRRFFAVILCAFMLTSCNENNGEEVPQTETTAFSESVTETTAETTKAQTAAEETTAVTEEEHLAENYVYAPPQEVLDAKFYSEDIETEIEWAHILTEEGYDRFDWQGRDDHILIDDMPKYIIEDISEYGLDNSVYFKEHGDERGEPDCGFSYMMYDMNDDGSEDYIVKCNVDYIWLPDSESFYKIYLSANDGSYTPIEWDCVEKFHPVQYILKTKTNGLHDIMVLHNKNYPIITYDGKSSYTPCEMIDERHTFKTSEMLPNNILHFNVRIFANDAPLGEYYTAVKVKDNRYIKNNMLYSCYPDGAPRSYIEKNIDEWQPDDFYASINGYDFYVELTDEGAKADNVQLDILEIKYVAAY